MDRGETELLLAFIEIGQKRILKHPLCETFLFLKWRRIRKFFLFSLFFHAIFVLSFTYFVLKIYVVECDKTNRDDQTCKETILTEFLAIFVLFINFIMLAKEMFQIAHGFIGYIKYWENWLQWTIIIGVNLCTVRNLKII